jgi:glycosyltransferase involved in cell wall biosynthesis
MALLAKKKNQKLIITLASSKSSSKMRSILEKAYLFALNIMKKKINCIIALSIFEKNYFEKKFSGITFEIIPIAHDYSPVKILKRKQKEVITVGRLVKNKGFHYVIDAFNELHKIDPDFRLVIIGGGPYKTTLMHKAKMFGIEKNIDFLGAISHSEHFRIIRKLKESAAFILLSTYESQCVAAIEAICSRTPAIVSNKSVFPEFNNAGLAFCIDEKKSIEIAKKIIEMYKNPTKFAPKQRDINKFYLIISCKKMGEQTSKIYLDLIHNKNIHKIKQG